MSGSSSIEPRNGTLNCPPSLAAALGEDVDLVMAVRADEVTHVFDNAENIDLYLLKHLDRFASVLQ